MFRVGDRVRYISGDILRFVIGEIGVVVEVDIRDTILDVRIDSDRTGRPLWTTSKNFELVGEKKMVKKTVTVDVPLEEEIVKLIETRMDNEMDIDPSHDFDSMVYEDNYYEAMRDVLEVLGFEPELETTTTHKITLNKV